MPTLNIKSAKFHQLTPKRGMPMPGSTQDTVMLSRATNKGAAKPKVHIYLGSNVMQKARLVPGDSVKVSLCADPRLCKLERTNAPGEGWKVRETAGAKSDDGTAARGTFVLTPTEEDMGIFFPNGTNRFSAAEVDANPREIVFSL